MVDVTLSIPDGNVAEVIETIVWLQAIPQIPDPNWVNPEDGTSAPLVDKYTGEHKEQKAKPSNASGKGSSGRNWKRFYRINEKLKGKQF